MTEVEKIHNEIDTAQDRLLNQAMLLISMNDVSQELKSKADRLLKIGFTSNPLIKDVLNKTNSLVKTTEQANTISHYKTEYPGLKFLTETEFDRICDKYKLIYAPVANYIKDIPEVNLKEIETVIELNPSDYFVNVIQIKVRIDNECISYLTDEEKELIYVKGFYINNKDLIGSGSGMYGYSPDIIVSKLLGRSILFQFSTIHCDIIARVEKSGLFIAAPKSHFNLNGLEKQGKGFFKIFKIEPKDPIVFRYVNGGIQVITKWGNEANDPNLIIF